MINNQNKLKTELFWNPKVQNWSIFTQDATSGEVENKGFPHRLETMGNMVWKKYYLKNELIYSIE